MWIRRLAVAGWEDRVTEYFCIHRTDRLQRIRPGIRLKAIRDGIQDYERPDPETLGQVPLVNSTLLPIATSWSTWSHDPNALEGARLLLGQLLHQLSPP